MTQPIKIESEAAMLALGNHISATFFRYVCEGNGRVGVVYLRGDLGAGKTTLTKGILQGLGYKGSVTSPTYTLVETYNLDAMTVYHFDLYRLQSPQELEYLGIRDMLIAPVLTLVEWPLNGRGVLPSADYDIQIDVDGTGRQVFLPVSLERPDL